MKNRAAIVMLLGAMTGCSQTNRLTMERPSGPLEPASRNLEIADAMVVRGRYLEASFFYEAALTVSTEEADILPKLIASQVRAGRLRAAGQNTERLISLVGEHPLLIRLSRLLALYAPPLSVSVPATEAAP